LCGYRSRGRSLWRDTELSQARLGRQVSIHEQGGGALAGPTGARSSPCALADSSQSTSLPEYGRNAGKAQWKEASSTIVSRCIPSIWIQVTARDWHLVGGHLLLATTGRRARQRAGCIHPGV